MAKASGATSGQKAGRTSPEVINSHGSDKSHEKKEAASHEAASNEAEAEIEAQIAAELAASEQAMNQAFSMEPKPEPAAEVKPAFTADVLNKLRSGFESDLMASAEALEATGRRWKLLDDQLVSARSEIERLRSLDEDHAQLKTRFEAERASGEKLAAEVAQLKISEKAAHERAAKFEEVCESVKERALEIHTAFQQSRNNEQQAQADLQRLRTELTELGRTLQDEGIARVAAEDRAKKLQTQVSDLETVEKDARERVAKLVQDNRTVAAQAQQLATDRDNWHKQFAASERENNRMQAEKRANAERISDLEGEIRTLRADLASTTSSLELTPEEQSAESGDTELDLASSLERAFAIDDSETTAEASQKPH